MRRALPHSWRCASARAHRMGDRAFGGKGLRCRFQPRQPFGADALAAPRPAPRPAPRARRCRVRRAGPRTAAASCAPRLGAEAHRTAHRVRGDEGIAPLGRVELLPDCAQLVHVVRAVQRLERQRAQQALRRRPSRSPGAWPAAARSCSASSGCRPGAWPAASGAAHGCAARRRAAVRPAAPARASASRSSSANSAASSRAPSSAGRAAGAALRQFERAARAAASRSARFCRRCALPACSRCASTVKSLSCASSGVSAWIASARCAAFARAAVAAAEILRQRFAQRGLRAAVAARRAPLVRALRQPGQRADRLHHASPARSRCRAAAAMNRFSDMSSRQPPQ